MSDEKPTTENSQVDKAQTELDETIEQIEKQEVKVENASTPAQEEKEQSKLDALLAKFDEQADRLSKIEARLNEPTVPAPEAKQTVETEEPKASQGAEGVTENEAAKPRKRRLGAW